MSELINTHDSRATIRWKLLTGASALALTACIAPAAKAEDTVQPILWVTLDGQFSQQKTDDELFVPPFMQASPFDGAAHAGLQKPPAGIWDKDAALTFQPTGSDWVLSAAIRYGKNSRSENNEQQIAHVPYKYFFNAYQNPITYSSQSHAILDFQAGRDVGLGKFGNSGSSVFSAGVRIAQFHSQSNVEVKSQPTNNVLTSGYHRFYATFAAKRKFSGIGPSLSWDASAMIIGNSSYSGISLDWGLNGSLLFGRQRTATHHQTKENHIISSTPSRQGGHLASRVPVYNYSTSLNRSKQVTVPNFGGFAGVSWRYSSAKVSLGYRADFFFGAMDGGIDATHRENVGFYGPFATIGIGIGG